MKKAGVIAVFALLLIASPVMARSGCCSHHAGVRADGCGCNDGTPLSSTCAPYYVCTANEEKTAPPVMPVRGTTPYPIVPTNTPTPTPTSTPTPTVAPTSTPTPTPTVVPTPFEISKQVKGTEDRRKKTFFDYFFDASLGRILFPQFGFFEIFNQ